MKSLPLKITDQSKHIQVSKEINFDSKKADKTKEQKAAKQFESMLAQIMVKSMTQSSGGLFGSENNFGGDMFEGFFENNLAEYLTEKHNFGIADAILKNMPDAKAENNEIQKAEAAQSIKAEKASSAEEADPIIPSNGSIGRLNKYEKYINEAAEKFGVDKNLIKSVILTESAANEKAVSKAKAKGLMQLMDGTAKDMGVRNVWHPKENIFGGTKYLSKLLSKYDNDISLSLAAYNAGPGNVNKYEGVPPFDETKNYIARVKGYYNYLNG